jgi:SPW repeat
MDMTKWRRESVLDIYNLLLAAVLFSSPWLFKLTNSVGELDLSTTGAVIAVFSLAAIAAYANWEEWINLVLGVWLITSPWMLGFAHTRAMHFSIGLGVVVAFLAALELWLQYDRTHFGGSHGDQVPPSAGSHQH